MAAASLMPQGGLSNPKPVLYTPSQNSADRCQDAIVNEIFDLIRDIKDPEHPHTLEELNVVRDDCITVQHRSGGAIRPSSDHTMEGRKSDSPEEDEEEEEELWIKIEFTPTVPHCSLATLIGLCLRAKLERYLDVNFKLDITLSKGTHTIEGDVNKQINDKERVAAAMENPNLRNVVEQCIKEVEY